MRERKNWSVRFMLCRVGHDDAPSSVLLLLWFMATLKQSSTFSLAAKCTHVWSVSAYGRVVRVERLLAKEVMQAYEETVHWICIYNFATNRDNCHIYCKGSVAIPQRMIQPWGKKTGRMAISEMLCQESTDQTFLLMTCELDEKVKIWFILHDKTLSRYTQRAFLM